MIDWLEIRQFAIAEHVALEFDNGFIALTGETGSGKSIIVDAVDILMGHRSDATYIRHDQDAAEIQAGCTLPEDHPALRWLAEQDMADGGDCILRRILRRDKPGRGYINGHAATVSQLRELGNLLVDIHGQSEHHSLLKRPVQLGLVDDAAGNHARLGEIRELHETLDGIARRMASLSNAGQAGRERAELLRFQIAELDELAPGADEWAPLQAAHRRLGHAQELTSGAKSVAFSLHDDEDGSINSLLARHAQELEALCGYDESLKPAAALVEEARVLVEEAARQLQPVFRDGDLDPEEARRIESRFAGFHGLARKHQVAPETLAEHHEELRRELDGLSDPEAELEKLQAQYDEALGAYRKTAAALTRKRKTTASRLAGEVTGIMQELGMSGGRFEIELRPVEAGKITRFGDESVEFMVTANPGQPMKPLGKVASGGELSRISLGIQVVMANKASVPTLVFDEVDVGIGGEVANVVGQKLKQLGNTAQVICITHLSQVAARGDHHFRVEKQGGRQVSVRVDKLDGEQRIEEIARMTVGENITRQSLAQAREMLGST